MCMHSVRQPHTPPAVLAYPTCSNIAKCIKLEGFYVEQSAYNLCIQVHKNQHLLGRDEMCNAIVLKTQTPFAIRHTGGYP